MVFQSVYLFADTIENNIKFGCPDATHEQVVEAAKKVCCHNFISALPDGYDTVIGEGGGTLSGGCLLYTSSVRDISPSFTYTKFPLFRMSSHRPVTQ